MPNGSINVNGTSFLWAISDKTVSSGSNKLRKALARAESIFFQKAVDYMSEAGSPKSKSADSDIGRCDKQPGAGHLAWHIRADTYGDWKFSTAATGRLHGMNKTDMTEALIDLFTISNRQGD